MNLVEFERILCSAALNSPLCDIPTVRRSTENTVNIRINLVLGGYIAAFYNQKTGRTSYAWILQGERVFGADNTGSWHIHPWNMSTEHQPISEPLTFEEFLHLVEQQAERYLKE